MRAERVITPNRTLAPGWATVTGGRITAVGAGPRPTAPAARELSGHWLLPGFVDLHCHGGGGADLADPDPHRLPAAVATAVAAHRAHGTTTLLASLVSAPLSTLLDQVGALAELVDDGLLAGVHLEGPFLAAARCGAHDPSVLRPPDADAVTALLRAGRGAVRMVTLAPELPGAPVAIRRFVEAGVLVAIGHTDATEAQARAAIEAGATVATHLYNGMPAPHHRAPGVVGAALDDDRVTVELICDGRHLAPTTVRLAARLAGPDRVALVTDAMAGAAAPDGRYRLGGQPVTVRDGAARLPDGTLAGGAVPLDAALRYAVHDAGLALPAAVAAATSVPARLLADGSAGRLGVIEPGAVADLVLLDQRLQVTTVLHRGHPNAAAIPSDGGSW